MQFLMIMAHDSEFSADQELVNSIFEWIEAHTKAGVRVTGAPLMPPDQARTISVKNHVLDVTPGPFTTGPLHTAAFEVIECDNLDSAVSIASTHPMATRATIEVRPIWAELAHPNEDA